ncbi:helix-turn-helix domain-containing protein [Cellulomonas wangsupingiae]|uniref:helix-turn-helix domain-containing protein n=1 Tax=Cellulomonas wangsupingiae TaxID=2968085 RepID=UPI003557D2E2
MTQREQPHPPCVDVSHDATVSLTPGHRGDTVANLSVLENGRARAVRSSTLTAICDALDRRPGDILDVEARAAPPR